MEGQSCLLSGGAPDSPMRHRTTTVHVRCAISFHSWRNRPLQLRAGWRTGHCPVHTGQSGAHWTVWCPLPTVGAGHASPADLAVDRCTGGRWLTGQSGASPDSPVNYSRTPPKFSRERPVRRKPVWHTGLSGAPRPSSSWLYTANTFPILFLLFLSLRYNTLVLKSMY